MSKKSKSFIGLTSGIAIVGMAAGFQVSASAHPGDLAMQNVAGKTSSESLQPSPRPTVYQTIHPTIAATAPADPNTTPVDSGAAVDSGSNVTTVDVSNTAPVQQTAPVDIAPAPVVQPPAPVVQPPATTTGAS